MKQILQQQIAELQYILQVTRAELAASQDRALSFEIQLSQDAEYISEMTNALAALRAECVQLRNVINDAIALLRRRIAEHHTLAGAGVVHPIAAGECWLSPCREINQVITAAASPPCRATFPAEVIG